MSGFLNVKGAVSDAAVDRQPEILVLLEEQDHANHNLQEALVELIDRLGPVLSESALCAHEVTPKPVVYSPIGHRIAASVERTETATAIVRSLLARLEV